MKRDIKRLLLHVERKLTKTIHEKPSKEALNHLAIFAGYQDWDSFRAEMHEGSDMSATEETPKQEKKK